MDIKVKIALNQEELQEYLVYQILGRKSISAIVEYETLKDILNELEQYIDESVDKYKCHIVEDEDDLYVITKEEYNDYIILEVSSLFEFNSDKEDYDVKYIESDVVFVEDMEFNIGDELEEELEDFICSNEIYNLYINDEEDELHSEKIEQYDTEYDTLEELLDSFTEKILETQGCPGCIREIVEELYFKGYKDGGRDEALALHDALNERLFGDE